MSHRARQLRGSHRVLVIVFSLVLIGAGAATPSVAAPGLGFAPGPAKTGVIRTVPRTPAQAGAWAAVTPRLPALVLPLRSPAAPRSGTTAPIATQSVPSILAYSGPPPKQIDGFAGIKLADGCSCEPPDPWLAAGGDFLVQSTNSFVRIFRRNGEQLLSVPMGAFFGIPGSEHPTDPRILWDVAHERWIGVALSFTGDFQSTYLNLAVSQTADPTQAWDLTAFAYGNQLPDYPGIAVTSNKVILTANEYLNGSAFIQSSLLVASWDDVNAGGSITAHYLTSDADATPRPAQMLSPAGSIHLITENVTSGDPMYYLISGTADALDIADPVDLTAALGVGPFALPPEPQQPGSPGTITTAVDERPTDAVWRKGHLWFTSSVPWSWDGGATTRSAVRLTELKTTSTAPLLRHDVVVGRAGHDAFMAGVGISGNGTLFAPYSESSGSQYIANRLIAFVPGSGFSSQVELAPGLATYAGTRWGDFLGVAADPQGSGAVWVATEEPAANGSWKTTVRRVAIDGDLPTVTKPMQNIRVVSKLGSSVDVRLSWTGADPTTGVARYRFAANIDGAGWAHANSVHGTSLIRSAEVGHTSRFRVRAVDSYGNRSPWQAGPSFETIVQEHWAATYAGRWATDTGDQFSKGRTKYSTRAGASATFTFTGRNVALVSALGRTRGAARIYVDGSLSATIDTHASKFMAQRIVWQHRWGPSRTHTIKVVVLGTAGHPRVDVDAFVVLE